MNNAAINYYFGGLEGLCLAVMAEAEKRLVTLEKMQAAVAAQPKPEDQLTALFELLLTTAANPPSDSWVVRVLLQHFLAPSPLLEPMIKKNFLVRASLLREIVGGIMGLPVDHPTVATGCINVFAPCFLLLFYDKSLLKRAFPAFGLSPQHVPRLAATMCRYAMTGLKAIARARHVKERRPEECRGATRIPSTSPGSATQGLPPEFSLALGPRNPLGGKSSGKLR